MTRNGRDWRGLGCEDGEVGDLVIERGGIARCGWTGDGV